MFTKPTVFILGAGASAELGLPVGSQLRDQIGSALTFRFDINQQTSGDPILYDVLRKRYGVKHGTYTKAGSEFAKAVGSFVSIDEALHYYSGRPEVVLLGKLAIVRHVTLINFNYDRSVEHYLYAALQEQLNLAADVTQAALDGLKVIRPYGTVGPPSWDPQGMPYGGHEYEY